MNKPRLCFTLLYANGMFHLSRNFKLQAVGDLSWLIDNYEFEFIARSIDELIILNVDKGEVNWQEFVSVVHKITTQCFMPVAIGGGIRSIDHAQILFANGADKIVLNSVYFEDPELVTLLVRNFGAQSIIASLDFMSEEGCEGEVFINCGQKKTSLTISDALKIVVRVGAGEVYLTSIDRDGTGMGYDLMAIERAYNLCDLPLIASGGADTYDRLAEGIRSGFVSAVSTSHLFNFMGSGLRDARNELINDGIGLSSWSFEELENAG